MRGEVERHGSAPRMSDYIQARLDLFIEDSEGRGQLCHCVVSRGARSGDGGVAFALAVTGIVDEQKGVARLPILRDEPGPIERERSVSAESDPDSFRQTLAVAARQIKRHLLSSEGGEFQLD